jgi:hypothetical protein
MFAVLGVGTSWDVSGGLRDCGDAGAFDVRKQAVEEPSVAAMHGTRG